MCKKEVKNNIVDYFITEAMKIEPTVDDNIIDFNHLKDYLLNNPEDFHKIPNNIRTIYQIILNRVGIYWDYFIAINGTKESINYYLLYDNAKGSIYDSRVYIYDCDRLDLYDKAIVSTLKSAKIEGVINCYNNSMLYCNSNATIYGYGNSLIITKDGNNSSSPYIELHDNSTLYNYCEDFDVDMYGASTIYSKEEGGIIHKYSICTNILHSDIYAQELIDTYFEAKNEFESNWIHMSDKDIYNGMQFKLGNMIYTIRDSMIQHLNLAQDWTKQVLVEYKDSNGNIQQAVISREAIIAYGLINKPKCK